MQPTGVLALAALVFAATTSPPPVAAAADQTGFIISAPAGVPSFNPAEWNQAFKLTLQGVPASLSSQQVLASLRFPNSLMPNLQLPNDCSGSGFDTTPASSVALVR